jgi:TolA-binding protein
MRMAEQADGIAAMLSGRAERVLGAATRELLESPLLGATLGRALAARAKATQAQEAAIGLLGVPSAGDVDRLTRRVRSLSDRLTSIEDSLARIESSMRRQSDQIDKRLQRVERQLEAATRTLDDLDAARPEEPVLVSRDQATLNANV